MGINNDRYQPTDLTILIFDLMHFITASAIIVLLDFTFYSVKIVLFYLDFFFFASLKVCLISILFQIMIMIVMYNLFNL